MESLPPTVDPDKSVFSVRTERRRVQLPVPAEDVPAHSHAAPVSNHRTSPPLDHAYQPVPPFAPFPDPSWSDAQLSTWLARLDHRVIVRLRYCQQLCPNLCGNFCGRPMLNRPRPHRDHFCGACHAARRAAEAFNPHWDMPGVIRHHPRRRQGGRYHGAPLLPTPAPGPDASEPSPEPPA
ncbi:unnamed protein product [Symbiodinium natans]|uniref:Uncharacterized protein n=1 Tax=Symbiodinium natans TaxID=878477 RepID=A0A812QST3_9DINO|nr:unnamed protein product [Symbiodinium natans]